MDVAGYSRGTQDKTWENSVYIPRKATPEETPKNTTMMQVSPLSPSSLGSEDVPLSA
ncbi:hypothetical protein K443DRAFT_15688 [Laccaria amethystina LaAM-08-1]|uniref:Uncharacterized protein n=1 Tax=Laccaria amethystina LaAM-08-1 TaxID=1095629 RepID=A0A0C9WGR8_9AGAR|nr:hypothetical protein K443DRAFT_15688 [Laccaria amethystina LaAM-08-1]